MYPVSNTIPRLISIVEVKLQIIKKNPKPLFIQNCLKLDRIIFCFIVYISEIFSLLKSCIISPIK